MGNSIHDSSRGSGKSGVTAGDHRREPALGEEPPRGGGCPFRRTAIGGIAFGPGPSGEPPCPVHRSDDGTYHVSNYGGARAVLRADGTRQAGFMAEEIARMPSTMRLPILFQEGPEHREQRIKTARFFSSSMTDTKYRDFMESIADELVDRLKTEGRADLSELSMEMAVRVAAQVVGLTDSRRPGMAHRIEAFFDQRPGQTGLAAAANEMRNQWRIFRFYTLDVLPAIKARRRTPREDVISHLINDGYSGFEILTECITFAAAGMVTTREFISVAAWHLLEHPSLMDAYLKAPEGERYDMLHELLRMEPVVGRLLRRAESDIHIPAADGGGRGEAPVGAKEGSRGSSDEGGGYTIPAGSLVSINIYDSNADEGAVGEDPLAFDHKRERPRGVQPYVMSFGDGHHRCPGAFLAIQETDIFLTRLLAVDGLEIERDPDLTRAELVKGYEIRNFLIRLAGGPAVP